MDRPVQRKPCETKDEDYPTPQKRPEQEESGPIGDKPLRIDINCKSHNDVDDENENSVCDCEKAKATHYLGWYERIHVVSGSLGKLRCRSKRILSERRMWQGDWQEDM